MNINSLKIIDYEYDHKIEVIEKILEFLLNHKNIKHIELQRALPCSAVEKVIKKINNNNNIISINFSCNINYYDSYFTSFLKENKRIINLKISPPSINRNLKEVNQLVEINKENAYKISSKITEYISDPMNIDQESLKKLPYYMLQSMRKREAAVKHLLVE
jgi:hypothetical protein